MAPAPKCSPCEQEKMILEAAEQSIAESSLLDFSMSSISKKAKLSMGSVYKHVQSKEDVLIALASFMFCKERALFEQLLSLPLTTPEKIIALSLLDKEKVQIYCFESQLGDMVGSKDLLDRGSEKLFSRMHKACD